MTMRWRCVLGLIALVLVGSVGPSWGWVRASVRFRHWPVSVGLGFPDPFWYPYDYPYYYPDYYPYSYYPYAYGYPYYPPPYAVAPAPLPEAPAPSADNSRYDPKTIDDKIAERRAFLDFQLADGDITRAQRDEGIRQLETIGKQAHAEADANGGYLSADQAKALLKEIQGGRGPVFMPRPESRPSPGGGARRDLTAVTDLALELRALLDQKLKDGDITKKQHDQEIEYLARIEKQARADADDAGGRLTAAQENDFVQQLHRAYYAINHNLIVP
jgi:hypothetical protein